MLQDRGLLAQEGARYVVAGDVSDLDVPETLHALVASRLDGLSVDERSLLQDASVLGQAFAPAAVAVLSGRAEADVAALLDGLVTKQVLARDDDPRSPERGQYVFLQALLRTVAYGTLARRTRRERHLAAAHYLEESWPGEVADIAEVLSSHYLEAIRADPDAEDVAELRASARETLTAAGRAAASLALGPEAERYFQQAAELAEDDAERAALAELAGRALAQSGEAEAAEARLREAVDLYRRAGRASGGPAAVYLAGLLRRGGRLEEARSTIEEFAAPEDPTVDTVVRAEGQVELASSLSMGGALDEARPLFEEALTVLEEEQAWAALAAALIGLGIHRMFEHRVQEAGGILRLSLRLAQEHDLPAVAVRAHYNLAAVEIENDRFVESLDEANAGLAVARERGDCAWERLLVMQSVAPLLALGRWDEAEPLATPLLEGEQDAQALFAASVLSQIAAARDDDEMFQRCRSVAEKDWDPTFVDLRASADLLLARDRLEAGAPGEALGLARPFLDAQATSAEAIAEAAALCVEA